MFFPGDPKKAVVTAYPPRILRQGIPQAREGRCWPGLLVSGFWTQLLRKKSDLVCLGFFAEQVKNSNFILLNVRNCPLLPFSTPPDGSTPHWTIKASSALIVRSGAFSRMQNITVGNTCCVYDPSAPPPGPTDDWSMTWVLCPDASFWSNRPQTGTKLIFIASGSCQQHQ